jgi:hypothetical protein
MIIRIEPKQGWLHPQHATAYMCMTPNGQESELMGIFLFATQLLVFVFPMLFTIFNEKGIEMNWALQTMNIGFVIAFIFFCFVRDFDGAVAHAHSKSAAMAAATEADSVDMEEQRKDKDVSGNSTSGDEGMSGDINIVEEVEKEAELESPVLISPMIEHGL